jgi:hypothetical protein
MCGEQIVAVAAATLSTDLAVIYEPFDQDQDDLIAGPATALIVDQIGAYVGKPSERSRVTLKKETVAEAPLLFLE